MTVLEPKVKDKRILQTVWVCMDPYVRKTGKRVLLYVDFENIFAQKIREFSEPYKVRLQAANEQFVARFRFAFESAD